MDAAGGGSPALGPVQRQMTPPAHPAGSWGSATHLELVRFSGSDQLGDEEVCVEKVHILIQEAVQDEQAIGPGRQGWVRV